MRQWGGVRTVVRWEAHVLVTDFQLKKNRTRRRSQMKHSCELDSAPGMLACNPRLGCVVARGATGGSGNGSEPGLRKCCCSHPSCFPRISLHSTPVPPAASPQRQRLIGFYLFYMRFHLRCLENRFFFFKCRSRHMPARVEFHPDRVVSQ